MSFIWGQRHFRFLRLSQNCSKRIFVQVKNDSSIRTIRLFVIWHFLGFRICQIRHETIVRRQFGAWVRHLFWQQSDWPIHRILKRVIYSKTLVYQDMLVSYTVDLKIQNSQILHLLVLDLCMFLTVFQNHKIYYNSSKKSNHRPLKILIS